MGINAHRRVMSPFFSLILVLALFGAGIGIASASDPVISITPTPKNVCVGDEFDVSVAVNPNGYDLQMAKVSLTYDSALVTMEPATTGGMFTTVFLAGTDDDAGTVTGIQGTGPGTSTPGNLAVLHMTATADGTFNLVITAAEVGLGSGTAPTPDVNLGVVNIANCEGDDPAISITPTPKNVCVGDEFDVSVAVNPNGYDLQMAKVSLTYDSALVTMEPATTGGMFTTVFLAGTDDDAGTVTGIQGTGPGTSTPGNLAVLHMTATADGTFNLVITAAEVGLGSGTAPTPDVNPGVVNIAALTTYYQDADGDGYGNSAVSQDACNQPTGYVTDNTDCNDDDDTVYPGATELCDGKDNDCVDGVPANEADADSDGFRICGGDCDDTNAAINPGADEVCGNGIDDNCDGQIDEGCCSCDFCYDLEAGLNFVSIPKTLVDSPKNATTVFDVDYYSGEFCLYYDASAGSFDLNADVKPCRGFLVYKNAAKTVCVDFDNAAPAPSQQLYVGWNMIGHVKTVAMPINDGTNADFVSITGLEEPEGNLLFRLMATYTGTGWSEYPGSLTDATPGAGYWIYMNHDVMMSGGFE